VCVYFYVLCGKIETDEERYETVQALHGCCLVCLVTEMSNYFCIKHGIYNDTHKLYKHMALDCGELHLKMGGWDIEKGEKGE